MDMEANVECWKNAGPFEQKVFKLSSELLGPCRSNLLEVIFDLNAPRLRSSVDAVLSATRCLSAGEYILVRLCVDMWCGEAGVEVNELYNLDPANFERALLVISKWRA